MKRSNFIATVVGAVAVTQVPIPAASVPVKVIKLSPSLLRDSTEEEIREAWWRAGMRMQLLAYRGIYEALGIEAEPEIKALEREYLA